MKKCIVGLVACLFAVAVFSHKCEAEKKKYTLGVLAGVSNETDAQYKSMITDIVGIYSKAHNIEITSKWYFGDAEFIKSVKKDKPDVVFLYIFDHIGDLKKKYGYSVLMSFHGFGIDKPRSCIYVKKENPAKNIEALRGTSAATYFFAFDYYLLRDLLGEKPEKFFGDLKPLANGISTLYALALDNADASFTYDATVEMMKKNNPGPVKKIRELACTKPYGAFPMLISKNAPPDTATVFKDFFLNTHKDPIYKKYRPLFNAYNLRFTPATDDDYLYVYDLIKKADAEGWKKDFEKWMAYVNENQ
ncbi:MAG: PhnD/SsuA/transferrin family substrate-binding protein [bacterium]